MRIPIIEAYPSTKSPLEVYRQAEASSPVSFFLDSVNYRAPNQQYSYIGAHPFLEVTMDGGKIEVRGEESGDYPPEALWDLLRRLFSKYRATSQPGIDFFTGGAVGFWGYSMATLFEKVSFRDKPQPELPWLYLGFYRDLIVYDHCRESYWLVTHPTGEEKTSKKAKQRSRGNLEKLKQYFEAAQTDDSSPMPRQTDFALKQFYPDISRTQFESMVKRAKEYIARGDIYQANLSQRFSFEFEGALLDLYENLRTINPSPFSSFLRIGDLAVVSCSPERLIQKRGKLCETRPIAGTRPRGTVALSDDEIEKDLLCNEKERAEHIMLVDLERNDLGRVCDYSSVRVEEMMTIERYSHVVHIVSRVIGQLSRGKDAFDLIQALFPGGTITGCPKVRCMEVIDELEPVGRGLYTGSIGYLDFRGDLDLNIVIRTLVLKRNQGHLQVGAGIVHDSEPSREYEETLQKGEALAQALAVSYKGHS